MSTEEESQAGVIQGKEAIIGYFLDTLSTFGLGLGKGLAFSMGLRLWGP